MGVGKTRIGIIAANNIRVSPYVYFYTDLLDENKIEYEIIYPQRGDIADNVKVTTHVIEWDAKKRDIQNYLHFRNRVIQLLTKEKYDKIVVLTTINAVLFGTWLKKHYKDRYIIDIRDFTHEDNKLYFMIEQSAIKHSLLNVISSAKFKSFLPENEYTECFNVNTQLENNSSVFHKKRSGQLIIGYVGTLTYVEQCKALMRLVKNDERFCFHFYGSSKNEQQLRDYAVTLGCDRICFFGAYQPEEKNIIIKQVDILFNVYGNHSPMLTCALSNKLTDAAVNKKAVLNSPGTFMHEKLGCCSFAMDLKSTENLDSLYNWYQEIEEDEADACLDRLIVEIGETNIQARKTILNALTR